MTREEADVALAQVLMDEPTREGQAEVVRVDFGAASVTPLSPRVDLSTRDVSRTLVLSR